MQKVVGSNPISRLSAMSDSDHKETTREGTERSTKRSGARRRGRRKAEAEAANGKRDEEATSKGSSRSQSKPPPKSKGKNAGAAEAQAEATPDAGKSGGGSLDHDGKVSSLLETTGEDVKRLLKAADDASKQIRVAARAEASDTTTEGAKGGVAGGSLVGRINKEVQQVLESADEAANKIREEAQGEARQVIEEARRHAEAVTRQQMDRVSEMTDQVLGELADVQVWLERLQGAYDQAMKAMNADLGEQEPSVWDTQPTAEVKDGDETEALRARLGKRTPRRAAQEPQEINEGARLLALQQKMAGVDPEVIERRLKTEFGIEDSKSILDGMDLQEAPPQETQKPKKR